MRQRKLFGVLLSVTMIINSASFLTIADDSIIGADYLAEVSSDEDLLTGDVADMPEMSLAGDDLLSDGSEAPAETQEDTLQDDSADENGTEEDAKEAFEIDGDVLLHFNGNEEKVVIPEGIKVIGEKAFAENKDLKEVVLPNSVETICEYAFAECDNLEKVIIGDGSSLRTIGKYAFINDTKLDVSFAEDIEDVAPEAFGEAEEPQTQENETPAASEEDDVEAAAAYAITKDLENVSVALGGTVNLTVTAAGTTSYKWQWSPDGTTWYDFTNNSGTFSFKMEQRFNNRQYRCYVSNGTTELLSKTAKVTVQGGYSITKDLEDVSVAVGGKVNLTVTAAGTTQYRWQWSPDGSTWYEFTNNSGTFSFTMEQRFNNRQYRCYVSNGTTELLSKTAKVTVSGYSITKDLENANVAIGGTVNLTLTAPGTTSYKWQWSPDGKTWYDFTNNSGTFTFKMEQRFNNRQYRCYVSDGKTELLSRTARVTVNDGYEITKELENVSVALGGTVNLTLTAPGTTSYRWQWSPDGASWYEFTNNSGTFTFKMEQRFNNRQYRCYVSNGKTELLSKTAKVTIIDNYAITKELTDVSMVVGGTVNLTLTAPGTTRYKWQWSPNGTTWYDFTNNSGTFTFTMEQRFNNRQYRCYVSNGTKELLSKTAKVTVDTNGYEITKDLADVSVALGGTVNLTVTAPGTTSYKWQWSPNGSVWYDFTNNSGTFTFKMEERFNNRQYRCYVSDGKSQLLTRSAKVTLKTDGYKITKDLADVSVGLGGTVNLTLTAPGTTSYKWQWSPNGTTWYNFTNNSGTFTFKMEQRFNNRQYRCYVSNGTTELLSKTAKVTIIDDGFEITKDLKSVGVAIGEKVELTVTAPGTTSYKWQWSPDGNSWYDIANNDKDTFSFTMEKRFNNRQYKCKVTNGTTTLETKAARVINYFTVSNITYEILTGDKTVSVIGYTGALASMTVASTVANPADSGLTYSVTEIGAEAFMDNMNLTSISLPNSITIIRERAFKNCNNLATMTNHD